MYVDIFVNQQFIIKLAIKSGYTGFHALNEIIILENYVCCLREVFSELGRMYLKHHAYNFSDLIGVPPKRRQRPRLVRDCIAVLARLGTRPDPEVGVCNGDQICDHSTNRL